jgi:iron complex transport system substrate-binding protein
LARAILGPARPLAVLKRALLRLRSIVRLLAVAALVCAAACSRSEPERRPDGDAKRVVSLAPAFTETLIALGAGDRVVGIGRFDPEIPGRPDVPRLGDAMGVNLEALTALRPDVVLVNARVLAEKLAPIASTVHVVELPTDRLNEALRAVGAIGRLVGRGREADAIVEAIRESLADASRRSKERRARGETPPRVLVVVQRRPYYSAGKNSFVDELLSFVGAENVFGDVDQPWPTVSEEAIVARAPTVILDASVGDVDTQAGRDALVAEWKRFPTIPAVRDGRVHVVREDAIFRAGPPACRRRRPTRRGSPSARARRSPPR